MRLDITIFRIYYLLTVSRGAPDERGWKDMVPNPVTIAKVIRVIEIREVRGDGTHDDPVRVATSYWSMDGKQLAVYDPVRRDQCEHRSEEET